MKSHLEQFDSLLVREEDGIKILSGMIDKLAYKVFDPTLLIRKEQWLSIRQTIKKHKRKIYTFISCSQSKKCNRYRQEK